jgi:hypothetical protein
MTSSDITSHGGAFVVHVRVDWLLLWQHSVLQYFPYLRNLASILIFNKFPSQVAPNSHFGQFWTNLPMKAEIHPLQYYSASHKNLPPHVLRLQSPWQWGPRVKVNNVAGLQQWAVSPFSIKQVHVNRTLRIQRTPNILYYEWINICGVCP